MSSTLEKKLNAIDSKLDQLTAAANLGGFISEETLLTITGYTYQSVWRLRKEGRIQAKKLGRVRFYRVNDLVDALEDAPLGSPPGSKR